MTGGELFHNALSLLGHDSGAGQTIMTDRVMAGAIANLNLVISDLRRVLKLPYKRVENLTETVDLPEEVLDIAACGLAGYIAKAEGDDINQYFWSSEYTARRGTLTRIERIENFWK